MINFIVKLNNKLFFKQINKIFKVFKEFQRIKVFFNRDAFKKFNYWNNVLLKINLLH